ncbi:uncharacterized protein LOC103788602 [Callithrix jacchus]|uniref:uncharacterized protein LOC103788602 n=1 Tax=Callithrix jacchus TaxID=9483 RepID=UPI00159D9C86|nr:uncharacterized protein LOC103788602 [Callithrix jacchus]
MAVGQGHCDKCLHSEGLLRFGSLLLPDSEPETGESRSDSHKPPLVCLCVGKKEVGSAGQGGKTWAGPLTTPPRTGPQTVTARKTARPCPPLALSPVPHGHSSALRRFGIPQARAPLAPLSPAPLGHSSALRPWRPSAPRPTGTPQPRAPLALCPATLLPRRLPEDTPFLDRAGLTPETQKGRRPKGPLCIPRVGEAREVQYKCLGPLGNRLQSRVHWGQAAASQRPRGGSCGLEERAGSWAALREPPGAMKAACLFLLASLLCSRRALSLQCYNCANVQGTSQCQTSQCVGVCFASDLVFTVNDGGEKKITMGIKSCAPSCEDASKTLQSLRPESLPQIPGGVGNLLTSEVKNLACCNRDLCNGAARARRSLGALAGGLLLSLGPLLLALL